MATFEATQGMVNQQHFEVLEIDLPIITGICTISGIPGTGTPLTCLDQTWSGEYKTYYFTNENCPVVLPSVNGEPIYRLITRISEAATEVMPGRGLSGRSSLTVTLNDIEKQDPNLHTAGVTNAVKNQGTYLGKLDERQIFESKEARLKLYRIQPDKTIDLANGAQTRSFITDTISLNKNGTWTLTFKDALSIVNLGEKTWPVNPENAVVRQDFDEDVVAIPVDEDTDYLSLYNANPNNFIVRIGKEFMKVNSVSGNLTSLAVLNVITRGLSMVANGSLKVLTRSVKDSHSGGDDVFICDVSDDETIDSFLTRVLTDSGLPASYIPASDWADEVNEWHPNDKLNILHSEAEDVNDVISRVTNGFLMDMWCDVTEAKVKLSAISVHKESTALLTEGKEINARTIKKVAKRNLRATRATVRYNQRDLADSDAFSSASIKSENALISDALYKEHKDKLFDDNFLLSRDAGDLLVQRYVSRYKFTPYERPFISDERYMTFKTGDIVDLVTTVDQTIYGLPSGNIRGQVTRINPRYDKGRTYDVKVLTYGAAFDSGSEIILDEPLASANLYILAGAPPQPIDLTFILDGSFSSGEVAISTGLFSTGSTITIILVNGFQGQANGGIGSNGGGSNPSNGVNGGVVLLCSPGINVNIYFSGATPSTAFPVADGFILAPGGGGGGAAHTNIGPGVFGGGDGGDGGAGILPGVGGGGGVGTGTGAPNGNNGVSGTETTGGSSGGDGGVGGDWGLPGGNGASNSGTGSTGGLAGSGIIDNGATVTLFGDVAGVNHINGQGDH